MIDPSARIHASADLEADVSVGAGTSIWHRTQIRTGARIGREAVIGRDVFIDAGVTLGDRVKVQNGALIYHGVTVADSVFIGPGVILTNDRRPRALNGAGDVARAADWTVSAVRIAVGASLGAGVIVVAGRNVGPHAMVGAGSVVTRDVPAHGLVVGNPARLVGWVCVCAERIVDSTGRPAAVTRSARDRALTCLACGRTFDQLGDDEGLRERARSGDEAATPA